MWRGYESEPDIAETLDWFRMFGALIMFIHTSGYASPAGLRTFASSVRPKATAPVQGVKWDKEY
jgi:mRNA degradation ribonuclease J1/J2